MGSKYATLKAFACRHLKYRHRATRKYNIYLSASACKESSSLQSRRTMHLAVRTIWTLKLTESLVRRVKKWFQGEVDGCFPDGGCDQCASEYLFR